MPHTRADSSWERTHVRLCGGRDRSSGFVSIHIFRSSTSANIDPRHIVVTSQRARLRLSLFRSCRSAFATRRCRRARAPPSNRNPRTVDRSPFESTLSLRAWAVVGRLGDAAACAAHTRRCARAQRHFLRTLVRSRARRRSSRPRRQSWLFDGAWRTPVAKYDFISHCVCPWASNTTIRECDATNAGCQCHQRHD